VDSRIFVVCVAIAVLCAGLILIGISEKSVQPLHDKCEAAGGVLINTGKRMDVCVQVIRLGNPQVQGTNGTTMP
jgi:hypothetical protein